MATSRPQQSQSFLNPDLAAAKADQRPAPPSPPAQESANRARQTDPGPGRGAPSAAGVRAPEGPEPAEIVVALVRAGSARHRKPLVLAGHQRSRPAHNNRRSHGLHRSRLGLPTSTGPGSSLSPRLPRASGPCQRGSRSSGRALPIVRGGAVTTPPEPQLSSPSPPCDLAGPRWGRSRAVNDRSASDNHG